MSSFVDSFIEWSSWSIDQNDEAMSYLFSRGCSEEQILRHKIGYVGSIYECDPSIDPNHDDITCESRPCDSCNFNAWSSKKNDVPGSRIVGNIVLPITSYAGSVVGFQLRSIHEKNYDTFMLRRRPEAYFFGLASNIDRIWSTGVCWIVEGPFDQIVIEKATQNPCVALTTSVPSTNQFMFFRRFCHTLYVCLDSDEAGRKGSKVVRDKLGNEYSVIDVKLPYSKDTKDPGDYWKILGDHGLRSLLRKVVGTWN